MAFFAAVLGALLVPRLVAGLPASGHAAYHVENVGDLRDSYDYIVIGGGTAGLTVADRLSETGEYSVLVLEHGYFYNASDPGDNRGSRQYNMTSVPQAGLGGRRVPLGMGFCVGGSSAINGMAVMRGTVKEYDIWGELGNEGSTWNWDGLMPFFRKAIYYNPPDPTFAKDYHVTYDIDAAWGQYNNTRLLASYPEGVSPEVNIIYEALKGIPGVEYPRDGNAGSHGVFWYPVSVDPKTGHRSYARTAHWDGLDRANYDIVTGARVNKILFDGDEASGVQFVRRGDDSGTKVRVRAGREVILSAGSIHTPQVLQLSGIGPADFLESVGIPVKVDLPGVGENFQDHPIGAGVIYNWHERPPTPAVTAGRNRSRSEGQGQGMVAYLSLPVTAPDEYEDIAAEYEAQDLAEFAADDLDERVLAGYRAQQRIFAREMRGRRVSFLDYIIGGPVGASPINLHVASRGTIRLNESDPQADPVVDYRALSNPVDVDLMIAYLRFFRRLFRTGDLGQYNATEIVPGANVTSRDALARYVRARYNPQGWHPVGTAAKMRRELGGVVDDHLRVYGVRRLRVIDASIMPTLIGGTTQFTAYTIGEKGASLVKETWGEEGDDGDRDEGDDR